MNNDLSLARIPLLGWDELRMRSKHVHAARVADGRQQDEGRELFQSSHLSCDFSFAPAKSDVCLCLCIRKAFCALGSSHYCWSVHSAVCGFEAVEKRDQTVQDVGQVQMILGKDWLTLKPSTAPSSILRALEKFSSLVLLSSIGHARCMHVLTAHAQLVPEVYALMIDHYS